MKRLALLLLIAFAPLPAQTISNVIVRDKNSRGAMITWTTSTASSCSTCASRISFDFPATPGGTAPGTLQNRTAVRGTTNSHNSTRRFERIQTAIPGSELYIAPESSTASQAAWSEHFLCTATCENCGSSDHAFFGDNSGLNCDAIGEYPHIDIASDAYTAPEPPVAPVHAGSTEAPASFDQTTAVAEGDLQAEITAAAARADGGTDELLTLTPGDIHRPELEGLDFYTLNNACPGSVTIRTLTDAKLVPPSKVSTDPSFEPRLAKIQINATDVGSIQNGKLFSMPTGNGTGCYFFENVEISAPDLSEVAKVTATITAINTTTDFITVDDASGFQNDDLVVVNLDGTGALAGDGPAHLCAKSGNTFQIRRGKSTTCSGATLVNLVGTYVSGGAVSRWIAQPVAAWLDTSPLRATVTGHGIGNYPEATILSGTANSVTIATNSGYQLAANNAVWIAGTSSATCDGLRSISSATGTPTVITLSTAGTDCSAAVTGTIRRMLGLSVFSTSDSDIGSYDPKAWYFHVIDSNTLEFPELNTQGAVTTPGYIAWEPNALYAVFENPDLGSAFRKTDLTLDRVFVRFPFPWRVRYFILGPDSDKFQISNSFLDIYGKWFRFNKTSKSGCLGGSVCVDGQIESNLTSYFAYFHGAHDWQFNNNTYFGPLDFFIDGGSVTVDSRDITWRQNKIYRRDSFAASAAESDNHVVGETYAIEIKTGYRVSWLGNYIKGARADFGQNGAAIEISSATAPSLTSLVAVGDHYFHSNTIERSSGGIYYASSIEHSDAVTGLSNRFEFTNNLFAGLDYPKYAMPQIAGRATSGGKTFGLDIPVNHLLFANNTMIVNRAQVPYPVHLGDAGRGNLAVFRNNVFGVTEGNAFGFPVFNFASGELPAITGAAQTMFESIFKVGESADPNSAFIDNKYVSMIQSSTSGSFSTKFASTAPSDTLCAFELAASANMDWDDIGVGSEIVGDPDDPCSESTATRFNTGFGASGWRWQNATFGADLDELEDDQGWVKNIAITENSSTSVTISWRAPNTLGCTVDITHTTLDFSSAANITRQTDAGGTQDQSETFTGLSELTTYQPRIGCQNAEPFVPTRRFTTGGVP